MGDLLVVLLAGALIFAAIALYVLPAGVAYMRDSRLFMPVLVVNLLLGWTVIGWVVAMVMAVWPDAERSEVAR